MLGKGERTRLNIIRKAAPVFNQNGYSGTSMARLMEKTGLEKGGIYRHFQSKQELAVAAFDYAWAEAKRQRLADIHSASTPLGKLRAMVDSFVDKPSTTAGGCPLLNTAVDSDDGDEELRAHARAALREWLDAVEAVLREGMEQREVRKDITPAAVASILVSTLEGSLMITRLKQDRHALEYARQYLHLLLDSVANPKKSTPSA